MTDNPTEARACGEPCNLNPEQYACIKPAGHDGKHADGVHRWETVTTDPAPAVQSDPAHTCEQKVNTVELTCRACAPWAAPWAAPAVPDEEALQAELRIRRYQRTEGGSILMFGPELGSDLTHVVQAVLASDWLAARDAAQQAKGAEKVREQIAKAINAELKLNADGVTADFTDRYNIGIETARRAALNPEEGQ